MIRYALKCSNDHAFDSWFQSAEAFDALVGRKLLECPECGETDIAKALMTPKVRDSKTKATEPAASRIPAVSEHTREQALAELRKKVEENSEYVGMNFASEARAIHAGDAPERSIYGEAGIGDARALIEDGVPVAPLPFAPRRKLN